METWDGSERREVNDVRTCPYHPDMKELLHEIRTQQNQHATDIMRVKDIVTNGLQKGLNDTSEGIKRVGETIKVFCIDFERRLKPLEDFNWFRIWVTDLRDNMFKNVIKLIFYITLTMGALHFSQKLIDKVFS
jgi:hypothetical protein